MVDVEVKERLEEGILIFDGAMGTMLQSSGLKLGELPEILNITDSKVIIEIHILRLVLILLLPTPLELTKLS